MERKRVGGRFVSEGLDGDGGARPGVKRAVAPPRPKYCRTFTRARVAEALPDIVKRFAEEAKKGSIAHAKVLMKIGGLDTGDVVPKSTKRRGKSLISLLMENFKDDGVEKAEAPPAELAMPEAESGGLEGCRLEPEA